MTYRRTAGSLVLLFASALSAAACGGTVVTPGTGGAGSGGSGSGGGTTAACPAMPPAIGQPCSSPGPICSFGTCCPTAYTCDGGHWTILPSDCPVAACPALPPANGQSCGSCLEMSPCVYPCSGGAADVIATCSAGGAWEINGSCPVPPPTPCGSTTCPAGEVCVEKISGPAMSWSCAPDPCGSGTLSCACAGSLCDAMHTCQVNGGTVYCTCVGC